MLSNALSKRRRPSRYEAPRRVRASTSPRSPAKWILRAVADLLRQVLEIRLVVLGQQDLGDPRPQGAEHLLLDAADRQHAAGERDLAGHRDVVPRRPAGERRDQRRRHVTPAEGPSFGIAPAGTWMCTSRLEALARDPERLGVRPGVRQAARADSFITSPSWPVRTSSPLPRMVDTSTNMMSPPIGV